VFVQMSETYEGCPTLNGIESVMSLERSVLIVLDKATNVPYLIIVIFFILVLEQVSTFVLLHSSSEED